MLNFILGTRIGSGGFGSVYYAQCEGQPCAAKEVFGGHSGNLKAAIKKEIKVIQHLHHRHIIQYFETVDHDGKTYILMDLAEHGSLAGAIGNGDISDWWTKTRIAHEIARGLEYIHRREILHRDLKTANVLLTKHMEVKICDFGLAKVKSLSASLSTDASFKGTVRWAAPEILEIKPKYSTKSDIYAFGMIMWAMAADCEEPFIEQRDNSVVIDHVLDGGREDLPEDTPVEYRSWVERCWHRDPNQRPDACAIILIDVGPVEEADKEEEDDDEDDFSLGSLEDEFSLDGLTMKEDSLSVLLEEAHRGSPEAQFELGERYEHGRAVEQNHAEAAVWYLKAAEQGYARAQTLVGTMYEHGRGIEKSDDKAAVWYQKAVEQGHADSQYRLGMMIMDGRGGLEQDDATAAALYSKAAIQGHADAQRLLGSFYKLGRGVRKNDGEALLWYRRSAQQNNAQAQYQLGLLYKVGRGVKQSQAEAFTYFSKSANQGNSRAQFFLASQYERGQGVAQSYAKAASWYLKSAEQGDAAAQKRLAFLFQTGKGIEQNCSEAVVWYRKAAEQGDAAAQTDLGSMYREGKGVEKDHAEAMRWYLKAAEQGYASA